MIAVDGSPSCLEGMVLTPPPSTKGDESQETEGSRDKGKGKAIVQDDGDSTVELGRGADTVEADWTEFEPPEALTSIGDLEGDIILQIVQQSIETIKARILWEEQEREAAEQVARPAQEKEVLPEYQESDIKGKQPEIIVEDLKEKNSDHIEEPSPPECPRAGIVRQNETKTFPSESLTRPIKRTLMGLFKKFNGGLDTGESSSAGARNGLLMSHLQSELATYSARKRFVLDLIRKSVGEETSTSSAASVKEPEVECVSCLDDFNPDDTVKAPCHHYCKPCFERLVAAACQNEQQWPPKCCLNNIPESTITANIDDRLTTQYFERAVEWNIKVGDRIYCSRPECSLFIPPENISRVDGVAECRARHLTCITCRNAQHQGEECPQDRDIASTSQLAEELGWRRCLGCHAFVEHREACQHMTCRCGAEFCYVCGARWRTCSCTIANLQEHKRNAEKRRRERDEEEKRIAEAIRQVEEYEREQALKAELLRQEQLRKEEERRRKELEERIRREGERRRDVASKFAELRGVLGKLNETQRSSVRETHQGTVAQLREKVEAGMAALLEQQTAQRESLSLRLRNKIVKRQEEAQVDCALRAAEEKLIEEEYTRKLRKYWTGCPNGEEEIASAIHDLRRKMNKAFAAWQKHADDQLDAYSFRVREELDIQQELADEKRRRLERAAREEEEVLVKKITAELRWVREVVQERERLLNAREVEELEKGEDIGDWFDEDLSKELLRLEDLSVAAVSTLAASETNKGEEDTNSELFRIPGAFVQ